MAFFINCLLMFFSTLMLTLGVLRVVCLIIYAYLAFVVIPGIWGKLVCAIILLSSGNILKAMQRRDRSKQPTTTQS